jgi:hypothetical protein
MPELIDALIFIFCLFVVVYVGVPAVRAIFGPSQPKKQINVDLGEVEKEVDAAVEAKQHADEVVSSAKLKVDATKQKIEEINKKV